MDEFLDQNDGLIRFGVFASVFLVMAVVELAWPRRKLMASKGRRWFTNMGISVTAGVLIRLMAIAVVPIAAVAAAFYAEDHKIGLLNQVPWPAWIKVVVSLVLLDLAIWGQHLASHKFSILWRLHKVHHADRDIDVTTAVRFHPIEIGLSMLWKIVVVMVLGAPPLAVFLFEVILNACAMFNHANIALPEWADRILRVAIVTPDMHRVHHSVLDHEHDTNYGFNLSVWDRLFRTYTAQPEGGHEGMTIGLHPYQTEEPTKLGWSLILPFRSPPPGPEPGQGSSDQGSSDQGSSNQGSSAATRD